MLIGGFFGFRLGLATLLAYVTEGAMGLPVFQGTPEKGIGIAYMMGPTGGYLAGFVVMAAILGIATDRAWHQIILTFLGIVLLAEIIMMSLGSGWLATSIGAARAWQFGVAPFILPDLIKVGIAATCLPLAGQLFEFRLRR